VKNLSKVRGMSRVSKVALTLGSVGLAGVASLGLAGSAYAAPNPNGNNAVVITSQDQADALSGTTINKNVDVPAGVTRPDGSPIWLQWAHVTGNVSVEGNLMMSADTVDGNVTVSGPGSFLGLSNYASHFGGGLNVQNSSGIYTGGPGTTSFGNWTQYNAPSQVDGKFTFTANSGGLYSAYPMHVNGKFTYTGNTGPVLDRSGLSVDGQQSIS
jgi:hypothetical protein